MTACDTGQNDIQMSRACPCTSCNQSFTFSASELLKELASGCSGAIWAAPPRVARGGAPPQLSDHRAFSLGLDYNFGV
eukprot:6188755-Pleurochrysis_carterae.AAC.2